MNITRNSNAIPNWKNDALLSSENLMLIQISGKYFLKYKNLLELFSEDSVFAPELLFDIFRLSWSTVKL